MCKICKIDYPQTKEFYTTHNGVPRCHMCRSCHSHLLKKRYDEKKKQGYRLKMVREPTQTSVREPTQTSVKDDYKEETKEEKDN